MSLLLTLVSTGIVYLTLDRILFRSEALAELSDYAINSFRGSILLGFICVAALLMIAFGIESMFRFHRLIGPIYVIEKMINAIAAGNLTQEFYLRKHDELKDLVAELLAMREQIRNNIRMDRQSVKNVNEQLNQLVNSMEHGAQTASLKKEIQEIQKELSNITSKFTI